jgi:signal transduction histidine kinase
MSPAPSLSFRIIILLLAGFVVLQACLWAAMTLPGGGDRRRPYNLPSPKQLATIVSLLERATPAQRPALVDAFNGSLYSVRLRPGAPAPDAETFATLRASYAAVLSGHEVRVSTHRPLIGRLLRRRPLLANLAAPVSLEVALTEGETLAVDSAVSPAVRSYLRGRAVAAGLAGLAVLVALVLAVRRTTRPLVRLAHGVRRFAGDLSAPDLPATGPPEIRELSLALNDMKTRISGLVSERTRVLAAVAHDMRTYLTRLRLRAEFIDDAEQRAKAAADLDEMAALLDDTLLLARQDADQALDLERLDLGAELAWIVAAHAELGRAVALEPVAASLEVSASRLALRRMLANLIDNGLRHGDRVRVSARADGDAALVEVADDGPGVPPDTLDRLGEPFGRLDPSRDRATGGAGLGLAIVKALAERQGGAVRFGNQPGGGLIVGLRFPRLG